MVQKAVFSIAPGLIFPICEVHDMQFSRSAKVVSRRVYKWMYGQSQVSPYILYTIQSAKYLLEQMYERNRRHCGTRFHPYTSGQGLRPRSMATYDLQLLDTRSHTRSTRLDSWDGYWVSTYNHRQCELFAEFLPYTHVVSLYNLSTYCDEQSTVTVTLAQTSVHVIGAGAEILNMILSWEVIARL